jgi:trk system potassium uptake protein TrkA
MRAVFIGAGSLTTMTAKQLLANGFEVIIIEKEKELIDEISADLAAGFIHGDGSKPAILREADPTATDFLFALTGNDQYNILACLVGRSLGFKRVVTRIEDPSYEHICIELGLKDLIVPDYTIARFLTDMCAGQNPLQVSAAIKGEARIFSFVAREQDEGSVSDLKLSDDSRVMFLYRGEKFLFADADTALQKGDEVVIITRNKTLPELEERWNPTISEQEPGEAQQQ